MTDEEIEAVARAIFARQGYAHASDERMFDPWTWEDEIASGYPAGADHARDDAKAAIAALDKLRGWQPIETAPKDGTIIDVWRAMATGGQRVPDCRWVAELSQWQGLHHAVCEKEATHWMPTPEAPE